MQANTIWPAGDDRTLIGSARVGSWSAEGDRLAVWLPDSTGAVHSVTPVGSVQQSWQDNEGERAFPAFSPDGQSFAFARSGVWQGATNPTLLADSSTARVSWSSESFEGRLAFDDAWSGGIWLREYGGTRQLVADLDASLPSISQDGTTVAYVHTDELVGKTIRVVAADQGQGIPGGFAADESDASHPLELNPPAGDATMPAVSPDGSQVAFISNRDGANAIYIAPSNGQGPAVRVPNSTITSEVTGLAWQPAVAAQPGMPTITGTVEVYKNLIAQRGPSTGSYPLKESYRWERCDQVCVPIENQTGLNYMVTPDDVGKRIRFTETLRNPAGGNEAHSLETTVVPPLPDTQGPAKPTIADFPQLTTDDAAFLTFTGAEAGGSYRCVVDGGEPVECASPFALGKRSAGWHDVSVWQIDAANNPGEIAEGGFYVAPASVPTPQITAMPALISNDPQPTFEFTGTASDSTFECALDGAGFAACALPFTAPALVDGPHTFKVREVKNGTPSEAAKHVWTVDTHAPAKPAVSGAPHGATKERSAVIELAGEQHAYFECRLNGKSVHPAATAKWYGCKSPVQLSELADGTYVFEARQTDEAGNASEPVTFTWTVDTQAPAAPVVKAGPADGTATTAGFQLGGEEGTAFQYRLDGGAWVKTPAAFELAGLAVGTHTIALRQVDAAGNPSEAVTLTWTVVAPAQPVATPTPAPAAPAKPKFTATVEDKQTGNQAGAATVTVERKSVDVGCQMTGVALKTCEVELYADVDADGKVQAAGRVLVGKGIVEADGKTNKLAVRVILNATGRELLRRNPQGLDVSVAITGTPVSGEAIKATGTARLVAKRSRVIVGGFDVNSPKLSAQAKRQLTKLAKKLAGGATVRIVGHTDNSADSSRYLRKLGLHRAQAVKQFLQAHGAKATYTLVTKAATAPRATNATKTGRALNRRVVLKIVR
jgi:outer membrane protein OmpA-like peptidoglycan-associated protein